MLRDHQLFGNRRGEEGLEVQKKRGSLWEDMVGNGSAFVSDKGDMGGVKSLQRGRTDNYGELWARGRDLVVGRHLLCRERKASPSHTISGR